MNRADLQRLSEIRLAEAECLLNASFWDGAYYLSGYVIECALKACIARLTREGDFPDKRLAIDSHVHDCSRLAGLAGLTLDLERELSANSDFAVNWNFVKNWSEASRYQVNGEQDARDLFQAISDPRKGILQWLRLRW